LEFNIKKNKVNGISIMQASRKQLEDIISILPSVQKINVKSEADYYGISHLIAKKLKLPFTPRSLVGWKHGWLIADLYYKEQITSGSNDTKFLVPLVEHEAFLHNQGVNAKAIGMPFVYLDDVVTEKIKRINNSLLVMPPHSLPYTEHEWDEDSYAKQINDLKKQFDLIVVCLHQSCIEKRLWVDAFEKYDIPWIIGADALDKNALIRMYKIFKSFEFMTTNAIGSHVIYAAYCGCKVSIYGNYAEFSSNDYQNDPLYNQFPFLLQHNLKYSTYNSIKTTFPYLFTSPIDAKIRIRWAEEQLGKANKVSYYELAKLLGWFPHDQVMFYAYKVYTKIKNKVAQILKI